jgi:hypothetical protein
MSPRDDKVWRQVVDDARIRPHEVRACEDGRHFPMTHQEIELVTERALQPPSHRSTRWATVRFAALAVVVIGLASTIASVTTPIFLAPASTPEKYTFLTALPAVKTADQPSDRIGCAHLVKDGCVEVWKGLKQLAQSKDASIARRAREHLDVLGRAIQGSFPRVVSMDVVDANDAIHSAQRAEETAQCLAHMDAACEAAIAAALCVTRHALDTTCDGVKRKRPIEWLRQLSR